MRRISVRLHRHANNLAGVFLFLAVAVPLWAQLGPSPGAQPQVTYTGKLRKLDARSVLLKLDDGRILSINRLGKTKFYKDSKAIKASEFGAGDHVSVDATEDQWGFLFALRMTLERSATPEERAQAIADASELPAASASSAAAESTENTGGRPTLKRKDAPKADSETSGRTDSTGAGNSAAQPSSQGAATSAQPPPQAPPQYGEEGPPPLLRRGSPPANPSHPSSPERADARQALPVVASASPVSRMDNSGPQDPLIEKAREATVAFSNKLPNFLCQEYMTRYARYSTISGWQPLDVVAAEIIYEDGKETYRNLRINDKPTDKKMEDLSGAWSTGEFASTLNDLFHPQTAARFRDGGESTFAGLHARVYDFDVEQENSHWMVQVEKQSLSPAFKGSVWIDTDTARVLRVEIQARNLPSGFPMDVVESAVDYSWVPIAGNSVLMPVHAESLGCQRSAQSCNRNIIDFRNYRKYTADSKITFDP